MVGCEGDASPYIAYGVIDAATQGCILRSAGETQRHKNPHSEPHEQLVPTAGLLYCPAGREAVDRTGAGFRQQVLELTGAEHDIVSASEPGDQRVRERNATAVLARAVAQGAERGGAQLHVEPQARTAPAFVSSEDGKYCAGRASVRFTCCTAELPSRLLAEVPRRLVSRDSDPDCHHDTPQVSMVPATVSSASQTKLCGRTAPAPLMTTKLPSISSLRILAGGTM